MKLSIKNLIILLGFGFCGSSIALVKWTTNPITLEEGQVNHFYSGVTLQTYVKQTDRGLSPIYFTIISGSSDVVEIDPDGWVHGEPQTHHVGLNQLTVKAYDEESSDTAILQINVHP